MVNYNVDEHTPNLPNLVQTELEEWLVCRDNLQADQAVLRTIADRAEEFFSYAGLWEDRDISLSSIRQKAWPRQSV